MARRRRAADGPTTRRRGRGRGGGAAGPGGSGAPPGMSVLAITTWLTGTLGVSWGGIPEGDCIMPFIPPGETLDTFKREIRRMDRSRLTVTVVEYERDYTVIYYEDPPGEAPPGYAFIITHIPLGENYSKFKKRYDPSAKLYFSYGVHSGDTGMPVTGEPKLEIEPFELARFRIVAARDLRLGEYKKLAARGRYAGDWGGYATEATGILADPFYETGRR